MSIPARLFRPILDLFSSVKLGITLLVVLFVYSSVGSAGILYPRSFVFWDLDNWDQIVVRHMPGLEMTEYEWFQWWPFTLLIGLICTNLVVTTVRRIPFKPVNYGVWTIHTGIITLALGSVWYFSAKVEGETPVLRRRLVIRVEGQPERSLAVLPGNRLVLAERNQRYQFDIVEVNPDWEILTGEEVGKRVYAVSVSVRTPQQTFVRQLLDGHPQFTEDVLPGEGRASKVRGMPIIDESVSLTLDYVPQNHFYLAHTDAIYLREVGRREWTERPIDGLPRYNDYIASHDEVWPVAANSHIPLTPLSIMVPATWQDDPLGGMTFRVGSYLRYAFEDTRRASGGGSFDPLLLLRLENDAGQTEHVELLARDPSLCSYAGGFARFAWIDDEVSFQEQVELAGGSLSIAVPGAGFLETVPLHTLAASAPESDGFRPIPNTEYQWRLVASENYRPNAEGALESLAIVEIRSPQRTWHRVILDGSSSMSSPARDLLVSEDETGGMRELPLDASIEMKYVPPAQVLLVGGPDEQTLRIVRPMGDNREPSIMTLAPGSRFEIGPSLSLVVEEFSRDSRLVTKPLIVPNAQRQRELDLQFRMIRVELPASVEGEPTSIWLKYHEFPFNSEAEALPGYPFQPTTITLSDGRQVELLFSRKRMLLPASIVLDDFEVDYHVGGYSGDNLSVNEWNSYLRFAAQDGLSNPQPVAVNRPGEHDGFWFFQSRWDPPGNAGGKNGAPSAGLNFTVLGVGNRDGVYVQLLGCAVAVMGMIYAFYIKPMIKRRNRDRVHAGLHEERAGERDKGPMESAPALVEIES